LVSSPPAHALRRLKEAGRQSVWLIHRPGEQPRTLKSWPLTPLLLAKLALGIAQPQRQLRGARRAARAGIMTAEVCGWRICWRRPRAWMELELTWVPGRCAIDLAVEGGPDGSQRRASAAVGCVVARLVEGGLFNRDLKLSNLIVDGGEGATAVWMIDTVGIRRLRRPAVEIARMLERLAVQPAERGIVLSPPMWVPAMRRALAGLPAVTRRAVVRRLKEHRRPVCG
jgi:hypothetical protein